MPMASDVDQNPAEETTGHVGDDMEEIRHDVDQKPAEDTTGNVDGMEETRQHVGKVKEEIVWCLKAGLTKAEMFRRLREKGFNPRIYYAVYKELRRQNEDFFTLYTLKVAVHTQISRLNIQLALYRLQLQRQANASGAGGHQGRHCGNPSCSGHHPVAVPAQHGQAPTLRAMPSAPVAAAPTSMATARHAHRRDVTGMPPPPLPTPNRGGHPGSSRGAHAVQQLAAGHRVPATQWPGAGAGARQVGRAVPSGWPAAGPGPSTSATPVASGVAGPFPPGQRGGDSHRVATPYGDSRNQHQRQQFSQQQRLQRVSQHQHQEFSQQQPQHSGFRHQHQHQQLPQPQQSESGFQHQRQQFSQQQLQGYQAQQHWHAGASSPFAAPQAGAQQQYPTPQHPLQQHGGGGNAGERQWGFSTPMPSHAEVQRPLPLSQLALQVGEQQRANSQLQQQRQHPPVEPPDSRQQRWQAGGGNSC